MVWHRGFEKYCEFRFWHYFEWKSWKICHFVCIKPFYLNLKKKKKKKKKRSVVQWTIYFYITMQNWKILQHSDIDMQHYAVNHVKKCGFEKNAFKARQVHLRTSYTSYRFSVYGLFFHGTFSTLFLKVQTIISWEFFSIF